MQASKSLARLRICADSSELSLLVVVISTKVPKESEYDQEIPQSHTADQPAAPCEESQNIYSNTTSVRKY